MCAWWEARGRRWVSVWVLPPAGAVGVSLGKLPQTCLVLGLDTSELMAGFTEVPGGQGAELECGCVHEHGSK